MACVSARRHGATEGARINKERTGVVPAMLMIAARLAAELQRDGGDPDDTLQSTSSIRNEVLFFMIQRALASRRKP